MNWLRQAFSQKQSAQQNSQEQLAELGSNGVLLSIEELIAYQGKTSLINLAPKQHVRSQMSGNYLARTKGKGMEFDEVRHYQTGDDIRTIDWRVTARTGKTHTKLFREEVERPVLIATDLGDTMNFGSQLLFKSLQASHLAALLAWNAKARGDRIGGIVFNQYQHSELKPRSRQQGVLHYLHALHEGQSFSVNQQLSLNQPNASQLKTSQQNGHDYFAENCARLRQLARPGSLVYLITDGYQLSETAVRHLSQISQHCELVVGLINDPLERALPEQNSMTVAITDGEQRQELNLASKTTHQNYQQAADQLHQQIDQQLQKAGARLLHLHTGQSLERQLKYGVSV